jgi:hypothetical protein
MNEKSYIGSLQGLEVDAIDSMRIGGGTQTDKSLPLKMKSYRIF